MGMITEADIKGLNAPSAAERLAALKGLAERSPAPEASENVNNHIHTIYSFSPYSPAGAVYKAWQSGLATAGIMDHDSLSGAEEFIEAGKITGVATTVGFECRCSMAGTPFEGRRLNNPDQLSLAYLAMHGIPRQSFERVREFLAPFRERRNVRNRAMLQRLNGLTAPISIDFDADVIPLSCSAEGGSVTERHILFALSLKLTEEIGRGRVLLDYLENTLKTRVAGAVAEKLLDTENDMYAYYLLGALKSGLVERFYIGAADECPSIEEFLSLAKETGAVPAYPYLGDVSESVTGDKKAQTFEDSYLDELFLWLLETGFKAVTYMPTRNTLPQLKRLMSLCERYGMFQISGEDINTPFQPFVCEALQKPEFKHLIRSTWALVGHEKAASKRLADGMFSPETIKEMPELTKRTEFFARKGIEKN